MIYFIKGVNSGNIKIGVSNDPGRRLATLQTGSAEPLEMLGTIGGDAKDERVLHERFRRFRIRRGGEWFRGEDELLRSIETILLGTVGELLEKHGATLWDIRGEAVHKTEGGDGRPFRLVCVARVARFDFRREIADMLFVARPDFELQSDPRGTVANGKPELWPTNARSLVAPVTSQVSFVWVTEVTLGGPQAFIPMPSPDKLWVMRQERTPHPADEAEVGSWVMHPERGPGEVVYDEDGCFGRTLGVRFLADRERHPFILKASPLRPMTAAEIDAAQATKAAIGAIEAITEGSTVFHPQHGRGTVIWVLPGASRRIAKVRFDKSSLQEFFNINDGELQLFEPETCSNQRNAP